MKRITAALALCPLLFLGCSSEETPVTDDGTPGYQSPGTTAVVYDAKCGCSIEGIGKCGNYVEIDGDYVVIEHQSFGVMEWCRDKEQGAQIKVTGAMTDGKYVATSYERVD